MKFDKPAGENPIDQLKVVGRPHDRIDGPLKTTGTARYAYEWHEEAPNAAYGYIVGSAIAKGRLTALDTDAAQKAPVPCLPRLGQTVENKMKYTQRFAICRLRRGDGRLSSARKRRRCWANDNTVGGIYLCFNDL